MHRAAAISTQAWTQIWEANVSERWKSDKYFATPLNYFMEMKSLVSEAEFREMAEAHLASTGATA